MLSLQYFPCFLQILRIFGSVVPGKGQQSLNISPEHRILGHIVICSFETFNFFADLFLHFITGRKLLKLLFEFICNICRIILSQFLTDQFQLFSQNIFSLIFINSGFHLFLKISADLHDLNLTAQNSSQNLIALFQSQGFQNLLFVLIG